MPILLPPRANTEFRLLCSECRKRNGDKDEGLRCIFHEYTNDPQNVVEFELRNRSDVVEWLEIAPSAQWRPYAGGNVFCVECLAATATYVIYDPRTREVVAA